MPSRTPFTPSRLPAVQHRAQGRRFEIANVGVPAAAEIALLLRLLANLDDLRVLRHPFDEIVDLELAKAMPEGEMLLRGQVLVLKEDDEVLEQGRADLGDNRFGQRLRKVDARDLGAKRAGDPIDVDAAASHLTTRRQ